MSRIDACLATDRRIDLREQRRLDLHEIQAAPDPRSGQTGQVAAHTATQRDDKIMPLDASSDERLANSFEWRVIFGILSCRHNDARTVDAGRYKRGFRGAEINLGDGFISDDRNSRIR